MDESALGIPFLDLSHQFECIRDELEGSIRRVLESRRFILGPEVEAFEREVAEWISSRAAIACASGSDAVLLALMAAGIGPGDEVVTSPFTFVATVTAITRLGATPIFVDIAPDTFNLDAEKLAAIITRKTRAIMPVHLFGCSADLDPILSVAKANSIPVIEDAAQAIGGSYRARQVGTIGQIGCFSFYPTKNLGCAGDGGLVVTDDEELADRLRILHVHGSRTRYSYDVIGINSRLDALQAAILRVKLPHLYDWTQARRRNAEQYHRLFSECGIDKYVRLPHAPEYAYHVYNQFTIRAHQRDGLRAHLDDSQISTEIYYPFPLHLERAFSFLGNRPGDYPEAERACGEVLSLPIYPGLSLEQQTRIVNAITHFYGI